jgi:alpha-tubulin suppressor-like RCC1 family protein
VATVRLAVAAVLLAAVADAARRRLLCAGAQHACVVMASGGLRCWGNGAALQSTSFLTTAASPGSLLWNDTVISIACGTAHVCAATPRGVYCWVSFRLRRDHWCAPPTPL